MAEMMIEQLKQIARSTESYPVDFDPAWQWVGYASKQKGLDSLKRNFNENTDFNLNQTVEVRIEGKRKIKRPVDKYFLTVDCFKSFCMMAGTKKGKEVRKYYLRIEKEYFDLRQHLADDRYLAELNIARNRDDLSRDEFRRLAFGLKPLEKESRRWSRPWEDRIREADSFIHRHFEITGYRPDWIKAIDAYRQYKREVSCFLPKEEFSSRMGKAGAVRSRRYNFETYEGLKYRR
jgi:phage anti-repressor protein